MLSHRLFYPILGLLMGLSLYALVKLGENAVLDRRLVDVGFVALSGFFAAWMALAWDLGPWRAGLLALALAAPIGGLLYGASLRYETMGPFWSQGVPFELALFLGLTPLPFLMAAGAGQGGYAGAFVKAWDLFLQGIAAVAFIALAWGGVYLAGETLALVGFDLWPWVFKTATPYLISGLALGLAMALVAGRTAAVPMGLLLWPLRLALVPLLALGAVFLVGYGAEGLSAALYPGVASTTLITLALGGIFAVTAALGPDAKGALRSPLLLWTVGPVALLIALLSLVTLTDLWTRVAAEGPALMDFYDALTALVALGFGLGYLIAFLLPGEQMGRMRAVNSGMLALSALLAILALTPALSGEDWVARMQKARVLEKAQAGAPYDLTPLLDIGVAGEKALLALQAQAEAEALPTLAQDAASAAQGLVRGVAAEALASATLKKLLPVQPPSAVPERDGLIESLPEYQLTALRHACSTPLPNGGPGCVMVMADFWPEAPGEEAVILAYPPGGPLRLEGYRRDGAFGWVYQAAVLTPPLDPSPGAGMALVEQLQSGFPGLTPLALQQLPLDNHAIFILPPS